MTSATSTETNRHPIEDYADAGHDVLNTIADRGTTHGDPEVFGTVFAGFLNAYLPAVLARAGGISPADAFVVLDLMKSARIAVGGPQPDHFRDKAGYGLLGLVHVSRVMAAGVARQDATDADQHAELGERLADAAEATHGPEGVVTVDDRDDHQDPPEVVDDVDDADLLSAALDPARTPFADLLDIEGAMRPGVTAGEVIARQERVVAVLRDEGRRLTATGAKPPSDNSLMALKSAFDRYVVTMRKAA